MKRLVVVPLALVLALLLVVPASAGAPVVDKGIYDFVTTLDPPLCPGLDILDHEVGTYVTKYFFDRDGNLLRIEAHYEGTDNLYNTANPDFVLTGLLKVNFVYYPAAGEATYSGLDGHIIVPGVGALMIEAGRLYGADDQLVGMTGRHTWRANNEEVMAKLCSLLAGN